MGRRPARGVDEVPHPGGQLVAAARRGRAHRHGERGHGRRLPLPARRLHVPADRRGPGAARPRRRLPRPGDHRPARRARDRRRVRQRHDPPHPDRGAPASHRVRRQGPGRRAAALAAGVLAVGGSVLAGLADPAGQGPVRGERLPGAVPRRRRRPARRLRQRPVPHADRPARLRRHRRRPRLGRRDRPRARPAAAVPDRVRGHPRPRARPPPGAGRAHDGGPVRPGHGRPGHPAAHPVAGPRRHRRCGRSARSCSARPSSACATPDPQPPASAPVPVQLKSQPQARTRATPLPAASRTRTPPPPGRPPR